VSWTPEVGCTLSHLKALATAYRQGHEVVLVLEDDADLTAEAIWPLSLSELAAKAPANWHCVNLCDFSTSLSWSQEVSFSAPPRPIPVGFSTVAYLVSRSGLAAATGALKDPAATIGQLKTCAADKLIFGILDQVYSCSFPMISAYNNHEEHDSTIHTDHTDMHCIWVRDMLKAQLGE